jgi:hypothetical protein
MVNLTSNSKQKWAIDTDYKNRIYTLHEEIVNKNVKMQLKHLIISLYLLFFARKDKEPVKNYHTTALQISKWCGNYQKTNLFIHYEFSNLHIKKVSLLQKKY